MAFVRSTRHHACPAVPCSARVSNGMFACEADWTRLPQEHKDAIRRTVGLPILHKDRRGALVGASLWYRDNPRVPSSCPDGGTRHHGCGASCWRVRNAGAS